MNSNEWMKTTKICLKYSVIRMYLRCCVEVKRVSLQKTTEKKQQQIQRPFNKFICINTQCVCVCVYFKYVRCYYYSCLLSFSISMYNADMKY